MEGERKEGKKGRREKQRRKERREGGKEGRKQGRVGQEQWGQRNKIIKKVKCDRPTDRPTD